ncbi:MAG TPA: PQQ-binding-like beta-propeller repeat protein, partial [Gemmatimonadales bacterium]|nr:PQQ-binding-like beta-propeller repeat protein [Gemmatimonadales bacterium]
MQLRGWAIQAVVGTLLATSMEAQAVDWPAYGRDLQGTRYLPADEITRENVKQLVVAWTYRTGETERRFATAKPTSFETTPLVIQGVMYVGTPLGRVIALDAATGRERWTFDPNIKRDVKYGDFASRGVSAWLDPEAREGSPCSRRVFIANPQSQLYALDAASGHPCRDFGEGHGRPEARTPDSSVRGRGLLHELSTAGDERLGHHRLFNRGQQPSGPGERRSAGLRCADGSAHVELGSHPSGSRRSGVWRVARNAGPQEWWGQRLVGSG